MFSNYDSADEIWKKCLSLIETIEKRKGLLSALWHQRVFNEKYFPGWSKIYERIIEECRGKNAHFATCKEVYDMIGNRTK